MPDEAKINLDLKIIEIQSYGNVTKEDIENSIKLCLKIFDLHGIKNVVVDTSSQVKMPSVSGIFQIFSNFPKQFNLAILIKENQKTEKDIRFGEDVAVNRGVNMKMFYTRTEAIKWLNEN